MLEEHKIDQNREIAGFRYSLIAELTNENLSEAEIRKLIREKALRTYQIPCSAKTKITAKSLQNWLKRFKNLGINGLMPKVRDDWGKSKKLTREEQDIFINFLSEHPYLTAKSAFLECQKKGHIKTDISSSALSRLVNAHGLDKKSRMRPVKEDTCLKYSFKYPLECVQSDFMHAFPVPDGKGKKKKAKLLTLMDDATRRILYAAFTFYETAEEFEKGLKSVLCMHGKIHRVYTDNGASFVSNETKRILSVLGIPIIHSRPYRPRGKGKQERFYRTLREQFLRPLDQDEIQSLEQLNVLLKNWLECEYHRNPHSGLEGRTPLDAWLANTRHIIAVDPSIDLDEVFLHRLKRRIYQDSTFSFNSKLYEVPSTLIGKMAVIKYDPQNLHTPLKVYLNEQFICEARLLDSYANTRVHRPGINKKTKEPPETGSKPPAEKTNVNYALDAAQIEIEEEK